MDKETLKKANELESLINQTRFGLNDLRKLQNAIKRNLVIDDVEYKDNLYSLCISEYSDGSGLSADLSRYLGNEDLLNVIIDTLQKQLDEYVVKFEGL